MPLLILVADDNPGIRLAIRDYLELSGYSVITAQDGQEALVLLETYHPHLMIADIKMPRKDGYELMKEVRNRPEFRLLPVIFLTERGSTAERIKGYQVGCDLYLPKPFEIEELVAVIRSLLERSQIIQTELRFRSNSASYEPTSEQTSEQTSDEKPEENLTEQTVDKRPTRINALAQKTHTTSDDSSALNVSLDSSEEKSKEPKENSHQENLKAQEDKSKEDKSKGDKYKTETLGALEHFHITHREQEVLELLTQGLSNIDIGHKLHLSPRTIEKYVSSLLRKTETSNRSELVGFSLKHRLVDFVD